MKNGGKFFEVIPYQDLVQSHLRNCVRDILKRIQEDGVFGEQHALITFATQYPGVQLSNDLKARYPQEMTIILQHEFWDLEVEEKKFSVSLSFEEAEKIIIPYASIIEYKDESEDFTLMFDVDISELTSTVEVKSLVDNVISLDLFRKPKQ